MKGAERRRKDLGTPGDEILKQDLTSHGPLVPLVPGTGDLGHPSEIFLIGDMIYHNFLL